MSRKVQLTFTKCPEPGCLEEVLAGTVRCLQGHWIWWNGENSAVRKSEVRWPMWGQVHFRGEKSLKTTHQKSLHPRQRVKVTSEEGDYYRIEDLEGSKLGRVHHTHVVIRINIRRKQPSSAELAGEDTRLKRLMAKKTLQDVASSIAYRTSKIRTADGAERDLLQLELDVLYARKRELSEK
jgi:hypothetical protein